MIQSYVFKIHQYCLRELNSTLAWFISPGIHLSEQQAFIEHLLCSSPVDTVGEQKWPEVMEREENSGGIMKANEAAGAGRGCVGDVGEFYLHLWEQRESLKSLTREEHDQRSILKGSSACTVKE